MQGEALFLSVRADLHALPGSFKSFHHSRREGSSRNCCLQTVCTLVREPVC